MVAGQMKIQQMAFMILGVFLFFILVGLFIVNIGLKDIKKSSESLQEDATFNALRTIANMPELNCDEKKQLCLDIDKIAIMSGTKDTEYNTLWPVASVTVYEISPRPKNQITCPADNCNVYPIWDNGQKNKNEIATFVSLCKTIKENGYVYDKCTLGKLVLGIISHE